MKQRGDIIIIIMERLLRIIKKSEGKLIGRTHTNIMEYQCIESGFFHMIPSKSLFKKIKSGDDTERNITNTFMNIDLQRNRYYIFANHEINPMDDIYSPSLKNKTLKINNHVFKNNNFIYNPHIQ